jgi:hypothetical protein
VPGRWRPIGEHRKGLVAWATTAPANPNLLVPYVVRRLEALPVTDDGLLAAKWAPPRKQLQRDLGHPDVRLVFCLWQCDKENHGRREGPPQTGPSCGWPSPSW